MKFLKRLMALILAINMALSYVPVMAQGLELEIVGEPTEIIETEEAEGDFETAAEETESSDNEFKGKKVSILSHSASTYDGVSNNTSYNSTIGKNDVYYTEGRHGVYLKDTWWMQTIDALGMELLVNNSWSGSCVFMPRKGESSVGYGDRAVNLHNDNTGEEPDVIMVYLGCNDFAYYKDTFGKAEDVDYSALIKDNGDGTFSYADPETTCEAYAIMLHKVTSRYPDAKIYCMTSTARRETDYTGDSYPDAGQPTEYCAELHTIAEDFGFPVVDLEKAIPKEIELFDKYMGDKRAHPNALGMDQITNEVLSVMLGEKAEIRHVLSEDGTVKEQAVLLGGSYSAEVEIPEGYIVSVLMGGEDISETAYKNGKIFIEKVTGDIEITAKRGAKNFRWELNSDVFDSVSQNGFSENKLTLLEGSISGGIFSGVKYSLADEIYLYHDKPWVMEWACTGDWDATLFANAEKGGVKGVDVIFRSATDYQLFAIGEHDGTQYNNYGIPTKELSLDMTKRHVYRLENRVAKDGSNMIWLYVDGEEIGPMNRHFIGSKKDTGNTSDWISGRDFSFGYMGTVVRPINYCSLEYVEVWENGKPESEDLAGKTISILGASISTYAGTSNGAAADTTNSTIRSNAKYYPHAVVKDVELNDTWWMQICNDLGLRLLVNNSWSGSSLLYERNGTVGAYVDRCVQLHDDTGENAGEEPDIIGIQMGTNDFQYYKETLGTADIDYSALIKENNDGTFTYAEPATSLEAAAIILHKISVRYPEAEVYYLNISQRIDGTDAKSFNTELKKVVEYFGANIVDIYGSIITPEIFDTHIGDGRVHPNKLGMDAYTEAFKRALIANTQYSVETHLVSFELKGVAADYGDNKIVVSGDSFEVNLTAEIEGVLDVAVTMGEKDITETAYKDGKISIEAVTDEVVITAKSAFEPQNYRFEFDGTDLVCVSGENALTKISGTTAGGVFSKTAYSLEKSVVLMHNMPWVVEWKCEGTWKNSGSSSGGRMFTTTDVNADYNARYIFKSASNWLIAMGEKDTKGSHNYGIALADHGIDGSVLHTYRLENRIAADGTNMIYLFVDGEEIGPMNNYYVGTTNKNTTSDWLSGKDFVFPYMGTDTHGFTNCSIDYIEVWENGHTHSYESVVTAPTCTEQGYTTYTCACGDSYVDNYTPVSTEHKYDDGTCVWCGTSKLGSGWLAPEFAEGDYTMVVLPDTQNMVAYHAEHYYNMMQWIADNAGELNIQAVLHMGDMVNTNNDTEWTVCKNGTDIIEAAGIPWMPMRGNHDDSAWFNRYYDYETFGKNQSWFGGSYHENKLDHTYWFVTAGGRGYMILSLGWAPSWDVLDWAKGVVEANADKNVIIACHAYMNKDGTLLDEGDAHCVSSYYPGYPNGDDVWNAFKGYENVVLAMGGHIHSPDVITFADENGIGREVTSLLFDRQNDDTTNRYGMVAVLTFHNDSDNVDINWYGTRYDALYGEKNQFDITVPHLCEHDFEISEKEATCIEAGGKYYVCNLCGGNYTEGETEALGHDYTEIVKEPTCTEAGYTALICERCGNTDKKAIPHDITDSFVWNEGYVISAKNGNTSTDKNWVASDYVDISGYDSIEIVTGDTVNAGTTLGLAFYDANKKYVSGIVHTDKTGSEYGILIHELEVPEKAVYIRTTWYSVNHEKYEGATLHEFYCIGYNTEIPALGHDYAEIVTAPTCAENGFTTLLCEHCGDEKAKTVVTDITNKFVWTDGKMIIATTGEIQNYPVWQASDYVDISGYDFIEIKTANTATKTSTTGLAFYDADKNYISGVIHTDKSGVYGILVHELEVPENAVYIRSTYYSKSHPNYMEAFGEFYCKAEAKEVVPATGHSFGEWFVTTEPTFTEKGEERRECENCEHFETREIAPKDYLVGDVNDDGKVNVLDANFIRRYAAKLIDLDAKQLAAADVNGDGKVNILDANYIRRFAAKLIDKFPVEG